VTDHEDIGRRLREEGQATAPPDLLPQVMAEVRAEPHRRQPRWMALPRWQPLAAWAAAAAVLVAIGVGLAHLPGGTSSSSSSSHEAARAAAGQPTGAASALGAAVYTLDRRDALSILGTYYPKRVAGIAGPVTVRVPRALFAGIARKLLAAEKHGPSSAGAQGTNSASARVIIKLMRAHAR
jgi:hypothetical protein